MIRIRVMAASPCCGTGRVDVARIHAGCLPLRKGIWCTRRCALMFPFSTRAILSHLASLHRPDTTLAQERVKNCREVRGDGVALAMLTGVGLIDGQEVEQVY